MIRGKSSDPWTRDSAELIMFLMSAPRHPFAPPAVGRIYLVLPD
jgi:hypothetical protein